MRADLHIAAPVSGSPHSARPELPIRIVLADGHASARRSVRRLLDAQEDFEVIAETADLPTVWRQVDARVSDVLVLDVQILNGSGTETIRRLRAQLPETEIVVLTMVASPEFARRAIDAGAIGFVLKDKADTELAAAVRDAAKGREYISSLVAVGVEALRRASGGGGLSPRESEVLRLIALGYTSAEMAAELHLSRRTVESHRARVYSKLGLSRRADLVQFALRRHLIGN